MKQPEWGCYSRLEEDRYGRWNISIYCFSYSSFLRLYPHYSGSVRGTFIRLQSLLCSDSYISCGEGSIPISLPSPFSFYSLHSHSFPIRSSSLFSIHSSFPFCSQTSSSPSRNHSISFVSSRSYFPSPSIRSSSCLSVLSLLFTHQWLIWPHFTLRSTVFNLTHPILLLPSSLFGSTVFPSW